MQAHWFKGEKIKKNHYILIEQNGLIFAEI